MGVTLRTRRWGLGQTATRHLVMALVCTLVSVLALTGCESKEYPPITGRSVDNGTGVELFQWTWPAITAECPTLAKLGYSYVQTSPPQESIVSDSPEAAYQPVSYKLESSLGTRDEFETMVATCGGVGLYVVVDVVLNNMAGVESGVGTGGTTFTQYNYPGLYSPGDFHQCGTPGNEIVDQATPEQRQNCELDNRADLNTSSATVQRALVAYLTDLQAIGVGTVRVVDAEYMRAADVVAIFNQLPKRMGRFYGGPGAAMDPGYRDNYDAVHAEDYLVQRSLRNIFGEGNLDEVMNEALDVQEFTYRRTFVTNHRIERNPEWAIADPQASLWADILLLGLDAGLPVVYSGYRFTRADAGPPLLPNNPARVQAASCDPATQVWTCHHRDPAIAGMVAFRSAVKDTDTERMVEDKLVGVWRGFEDRGRGFVAINTGDQAVEVPWDTGLPQGSYCNLLVPDCAQAIEVSDGSLITTPLAAGQAIAIAKYRPAVPSS